jgi:hypothetical protein
MAHAPVEQVLVAFARVQVVPQAPQVLTVFSCVSHPLELLPSQLPHPALHELIWQVPVEHVGVALARAQTVPHPPQLVRVLSGVSHPFGAFASQFPQPVEQTGAHAPDEQLVVPCPLVHTTPQAPQFEVVVRAVSHPSATLRLQLP